MSREKRAKYVEMFKNATTYDEQADIAKNEFLDKFSKEEMFELMWAYRSSVKFLIGHWIYPDDPKEGFRLLKHAEEGAVLAANARIKNKKGLN